MKNIEMQKNQKGGFSLVELIVVIAIMAVMVAVLAPALLSYVENSRAQKDDSAMGEVANSIQLALADQDVYDEMLHYTVSNNFSCYTDSKFTATSGNTLTGGDGKASYEQYDDTTRIEDEEPYKANGTMRGVTITFNPERSTNNSVFVLADAKVNDMTTGNRTVAAATRTLTWSDNAAAFAAEDLDALTTGAKTGMLYNKLRAQIGDKITLTSQTYRNSSYTVFVRMGTTGGNKASAQSAVKVYGQWNGTNLSAQAPTA